MQHDLSRKPARSLKIGVSRAAEPEVALAEIAAQLRGGTSSFIFLLVPGRMCPETLAAALPGKLLRAIEKSNRIMAEDIIRESGYMLPQSENSVRFLKSLLSGGMEGLPAEAVEKLIRAIDAD